MKTKKNEMVVPEKLAKTIRHCAQLCGIPLGHFLEMMVEHIDPEHNGGTGNLQPFVVSYLYDTPEDALAAGKRVFGGVSIQTEPYGKLWGIREHDIREQLASRLIHVSFT